MRDGSFSMRRIQEAVKTKSLGAVARFFYVELGARKKAKREKRWVTPVPRALAPALDGCDSAQLRPVCPARGVRRREIELLALERGGQRTGSVTPSAERLH